MLNVGLDEATGIAVLQPVGELAESDFVSAAKIIDAYIEKHGGLKGVVIHVKSFPGWDSFGSLVAHLKFVKAHHKELSRVAFATNSPIGKLAEKVANHFVAAEVRNFDFGDLDAAKQWVMGSETH